jgi:AraC family ethanolamine operon transcriptional activator
MGLYEYIKNKRLNAARRELLKGGTTVTDAALEFGFTHFSHFAQSYARLFGELPSRTLRC